MKKFLIAGSSLAAVGAAGAAGAVDVTLGGSIDMGVEFGIGKDKGDLAVGSAYNNISLSIAAAGTTDAGMKFGGSFSLGTAAELEFNAYDTDADASGVQKALIKMTVAGGKDIEAAAYNVSGGQMISAKDIVGVKINSDWMSVGNTFTDYQLKEIADPLGGKDVCKVAGIVADGAAFGVDVNGDGDVVAPAALDFVVRQDASGDLTEDGGVGVFVNAYLPAGRVVTAGMEDADGAALKFGGNDAVNAAFILTAMGVDGADNADGAKAVSVSGNDVNNLVGDDGDDTDSDPDGINIKAASVFAGPFMEVKLASSSTKMVVGAVCVEGVDGSETNYFMDNASKVVTASDASIYIEGGFGKITLQTGDYAGGVAAIGSAGDAADLEVSGLGVIIGGVGMLGANPFIAVDLADKSNPSNLNILTGGTIDMGGLSAAVDVMVNSSDVVDIASWDLGLSYAMGDMNVAFAYDSGNDWGLSASMAVAGFAVDATFASDDADDHEKSGITYGVNASTSLNGFGLSLGVDQDMKPTVGLSKSMGGLSLYAGYDAADNGGKVGATLSF